MTNFALHVHHLGPVIEALTEPIENRVSYIRDNKPAHEVETRLQLMRQLTDDETAMLPTAYVKAWEAYVKAWEAAVKAWEVYDEARNAYVKARNAYVKAWEVYVEAMDACAPELEALHARICVPDCPWDGKTIFPQ